MKITVLHRSDITRYAGDFASLSAFRLHPSPVIADREENEQSGGGEMQRKGDSISFFYVEQESHITVRVTVAKDEMTVTRGGAGLSFRTGTATTFSYRAAYGELPMEVYTEQISLREREGAMLLTLVYYAVLGDMAQKNEMRFKITKA